MPRDSHSLYTSSSSACSSGFIFAECVLTPLRSPQRSGKLRAAAAYQATVLGLSAVFLLLGTFFGRAGGIILVGLVAAAVTVATTVADKWDPHSTTVIPTSSAQVQSEYTMDVGIDVAVARNTGGFSCLTAKVGR